MTSSETNFIPIGKGFVELVDVFPGVDTEQAILRSARVSYNKDLNDSTPERDQSLLDFLIEKKHTSPLEMVRFKFHIKCPHAIEVQILRHRTANVNCQSHRYTKADEEWYTPVTCAADIRYQSDVNRQVSVSSPSHSEQEEREIVEIYQEMESLTKRCFELYEKLLDRKVAREQARFYLPFGIYKRMHWSMDLHNLLHFLRLRRAPDAQYEIQQYADAIYTLVKPFVPNVIASYERHVLKSITFNTDEIEAIQKVHGNLTGCELETSSKRKQMEFQEKINQLL